MHHRHPLPTLVLAAALATSSLTAIAGSRKVNADPARGDATPALTAVETARTAHQLVRYGDASKDPLALITAARMLRETGARPGDSRPERSRANDKGKADKPASDARFSVEAILARARTLAGSRTDLLALVDDVAGSTVRGAASGPWRWTEVVNGGATDTYRITFRGGEAAAIAISGDGDSDLDLYVYDEQGNLICKDESASDDMLCRWHPRWTGPFLIRVRNHGVANAYVAMHN